MPAPVYLVYASYASRYCLNRSFSSLVTEFHQLPEIHLSQGNWYFVFGNDSTFAFFSNIFINDAMRSALVWNDWTSIKKFKISMCPFLIPGSQVLLRLQSKETQYCVIAFCNFDINLWNAVNAGHSPIAPLVSNASKPSGAEHKAF